MKLIHAIKLLKLFENCEGCGSDLIGPGAGGIEIKEDTFRRFCNCNYESLVIMTPEINEWLNDDPTGEAF